MIRQLVSGVCQFLPQTSTAIQRCSAANATSAMWTPWSLTFVRNKKRFHFPHPNERMRIKKHGWFTRMATPAGRRILMRRILRGKHVLSH